MEPLRSECLRSFIDPSKNVNWNSLSYLILGQVSCLRMVGGRTRSFGVSQFTDAGSVVSDMRPGHPGANKGASNRGSLHTNYPFPNKLTQMNSGFDSLQTEFMLSCQSTLRSTISSNIYIYNYNSKRNQNSFSVFIDILFCHGYRNRLTRGGVAGIVAEYFMTSGASNLQMVPHSAYFYREHRWSYVTSWHIE